MNERDAKGRFVKGNRGNPNPVCCFAKGNTAAVKHYGYAKGYLKRDFAQFNYLASKFHEDYPNGSPEQLYAFIKANWVDLTPESNQVYRN
ncbi:hypothetical protein [Vibrio furnissii]|uniref:hypothetical protein n=1 Tax=Vibrio furnissii TaxID=29494 RepID=UPI003AA8E34E